MQGCLRNADLGRSWPLLALLAAAPNAQAHGEEVLVPLYAQLIALGLCIAALYLVRPARPYKLIGVSGALLGIVTMLWATRDWPYDANQALIIALAVIAPVFATWAAVSLAIVIARKR